MEKVYTYLALGDSYTIGEAVPLHKSFPYQTVDLLRNEKVHMAAPEIIAKTGWTTDELSNAISEHKFLGHYDFVTLLIGVNNQYRGRRLEEYSIELEALVKQALLFAAKKAEHVFILSIPDYSVTPFAKNLDAAKISAEIDQYNVVKRALATQYKIAYIEITEGTRLAYSNQKLLAEDGLHPSEREYKKWAGKLADAMKGFIK